uniref:Probable salivary secreted peptide n=1 Tax=Cacopsylla melanoneura TaxID=428564 RepID=A0A8D8UFG6_9HEMI
MQSLKMLPACVCFLSLLVTSSTAAANLPQHLRGNNEQDQVGDDIAGVKTEPEILHFINGGEDKLTPNEVEDLFGSKGDVAYKAEDLFGSKAQDVKVGAWKQDGVHNLTVGYTTYQDKALLQQYVYKPYRFARIVELNVSYPLNNTGNRFYIISRLEAYDQHRDSSDAGYAKIIKGGVGNRNVTLHLESKRNHGLKYLVGLWGRYVN